MKRRLAAWPAAVVALTVLAATPASASHHRWYRHHRYVRYYRGHRYYSAPIYYSSPLYYSAPVYSSPPVYYYSAPVYSSVYPYEYPAGSLDCYPQRYHRWNRQYGSVYYSSGYRTMYPGYRSAYSRTTLIPGRYYRRGRHHWR